ncbi:hypothetical protein ACQ4M3_42330, partial [Leptolyngbya sp. AN03gr2]
IGGGSLYRHRDLWHPQFLMDDSLGYLEQLKPENSPQNSTSLLPSDGGNNASSNPSSDSTIQDPALIGGNSSIHRGSNPDTEANPIESSLHAQAQREVYEEAIQLAIEQQDIQRSALSPKHVERMQRFLESGDPILIAEARAWVALNPGVLKMNSSPSQPDRTD